VIAEAAVRVRRGECLDRREMYELIRALMQGEGDDAAVQDLLVALHERGETVDELVGAAEAMRALALPLPEAPPGAIDTCGTGGDRSGTFNISPVAALVLAGASVPVAKHGNRSATSRCGSADVLEALGVRLDIEPEHMARSVEEVGIGFLFARTCHPAMARVAPIRARIPTPTLFNRLGPLTNPMRVRRQLIGVADPSLLDPTLDVLVALGAESAWVVHGRDGLDEITLTDATDVSRYLRGRRDRLTLEQGEHLPSCRPEALRGGEPEQNAHIAREVLSGKPGPRRDVVLLNAAAGLCVAGRAETIAEALPLAVRSIDSGAALDVLERWIAFTAALGARG
jgi:anthranilate phosphoribosyltransferase